MTLPSATAPASPSAPIAPQVIFDARTEIRAVTVSDADEQDIVAQVFATRYPERYDGDLRKRIDIGASPRGATRPALLQDRRDHGSRRARPRQNANPAV
jgi:hypothetical protein